jgi:hypothetical protein
LKVNVLYVAVPKTMRGGQLLLRHPNRDRAALEAAAAATAGDSEGGGTGGEAFEAAAVDVAVAPRPNRAVTFRGDAEHCVQAFATGGGQPLFSRASSSSPSPWRASVVLEQYAVAPGRYDATLRFELVKPEEYLRAYG